MALWYACHGGQREMAELLVDSGADVNYAAAWNGSTPLQAALRTGAGRV
jgi:uncharacterized protein